MAKRKILTKPSSKVTILDFQEVKPPEKVLEMNLGRPKPKPKPFFRSPPPLSKDITNGS